MGGGSSKMAPYTAEPFKMPKPLRPEKVPSMEVADGIDMLYGPLLEHPVLLYGQQAKVITELAGVDVCPDTVGVGKGPFSHGTGRCAILHVTPRKMVIRVFFKNGLKYELLSPAPQPDKEP